MDLLSGDGQVGITQYNLQVMEGIEARSLLIQRGNRVIIQIY